MIPWGWSLLQLLYGVLIDGVDHVEHLDTLLAKGLQEGRDSGDALPGDVEDVILAFLHAVHVLRDLLVSQGKQRRGVSLGVPPNQALGRSADSAEEVQCCTTPSASSHRFPSKPGTKHVIRHGRSTLSKCTTSPAVTSNYNMNAGLHTAPQRTARTWPLAAAQYT